MTAPPAGALEACLALLEKATPGYWHAMIRGDYGNGNEADVNGSDGNEVEGAEFTEAGNVPTIRGQMRDADARAIVAAVNLLKDHGPALLAALRLREWRPVSERLPERDGLGAVLAFDADRSRKGVWLETSHPSWWGKYNDATCEWMPNITHWMPLPAPPTADDLARVLEESATGGDAGSA